MSDVSDELLQAGIRDAQIALLAIQGFSPAWQTFAGACQAQQFDLAALHGERLVVLVESAIDLFLAANKRISQSQQLAQEPDE